VKHQKNCFTEILLTCDRKKLVATTAVASVGSN